VKKKSDIANTLRTIADKLDQGKLTLKQDQNETIVEFPDHIVLELKVEEEQGRRLKKTLEIELEWIISEDGSSDTQIL
jgi:amphi-Trp domain-containing protein